MGTPVTKLDQHYSGEKAVAASWDETRQVLETAELFWVSTVRADGRPHVTPVVGAWCGDALWFTTGADEQKYLNLGVNPQVVLTTGCNTWDRAGAGGGGVRGQVARRLAVHRARRPLLQRGQRRLAVRGVRGDPGPGVRALQGRAVRRHHAPVLTFLDRPIITPYDTTYGETRA